MAIPFHKAVSSIEAIQSSIEYDAQVYRWFLRYITHPAVQNRQTKCLDLQKQYNALKKFTRYTWVLLFAFLGITITVFVTTKYLFFLLAGPVIWGIYKCSSLRREKVASISCSMLKENNENIQFESKTLFQICEIYGRRLNIPTLVDTITSQDAIMRKTFICACVITCFIYPLDFWNNWLIVFASFFLIQTIINTPLVFDRLK